ncbi:hypothetical protein M409DRAFT_62854 [Zasmidium cellare ATCC 36951]|uniref:Uncharacterized protein n=1 Tax=Zasmidium cellare ATCC 36951 TaxID=1080233 RepID=A0A6A6D4M1_ZASCE|nr:uncharacterized protein M409DRAFT_62854 [Zasmidium cellare ATCC 36951]KAF2173320.1 hypothetical protein M409DRAFT_62854 [Zasmidium cellare ATCC 36951]
MPDSTLVGSIAHASQENQLSLASLNFDFSLVKLEAPAEYQALGASLSPLRRKAAEQGHSHVTARKLGALFQQLLPSTPKLLKAYGSRASEIARDPRLEANPAYLDGVFPEHAGVDGTSIWAAATSGQGAIEMHLLACMLARMWSSSEATSIWVELVEGRKDDISRCDPSEPLHLSTMTAAQVHITRDQLAEWDNSARSWLRTADEANQSKQKQLMLILRNLSLPISAERSTYRSVLDTWLSALSMMERVLCGTAQRVETGAILLGLSSWHLYPDLNDPLVSKSGVVTVGIETSPAQQATGPYWSLPLAHLKHYGSPECVQRTLSDDSERLTFDEYLAVALGSFLTNWDDPAQNIQEYSEVIITFVEYLRNCPLPMPTTGILDIAMLTEQKRSKSVVDNS